MAPTATATTPRPPPPQSNPVLRRARSAWERDAGLPPKVRLAKAASYASELVSARVHLHGVDRVGSGVRTLGRPRIENRGRMTIGASTVLRSVTVPVELVSGAHGELCIGQRNIINVGASLAAEGLIRTGNRVLIGPYVMINDTSYHDLHERHVQPSAQPVEIEDDVWLGAKSTVLPGVRIGRGAVVAAHALVNRDVEPFTVVSGVPAVVVARLNPKKFRVEDFGVDDFAGRKRS